MSDPDTVLLLILHGMNDDFGFEFLDGGAIQFRLPAEALANEDWNRITAYADSH